MHSLRYINLGLVKPEFIQPLWEYSRIIIPEVPTLFVFRLSETTLGRVGQKELEETIRIEDVPENVKLIRLYGQDTGAYLITPGTVFFYLHYPNGISKTEAEKAMKVAVLRVLRKYGFQVEAEGNDIFLTVGNKRKKLGGTMFYRFGDCAVFSVTLLFEFNAVLANKVYRFDSAKFTKKGDVTDIGDIVGGLWEVKPDIEMDAVVKEMVKTIADRFDLEIETGSLTATEVEKMDTLVQSLDKDNWRIHGRRPDIK